MWAETNFVGDIIKIRIGAPLYTDPADSNSFVYTPAAPLLTYGISWVIGKPTSIIAWRIIQLSFVFCSSLLATACCRILTRLAYPDYRTPFIKTWFVFSFFGLLLPATAPRTNPFSYCLHADALALLISTISFLTMLHYLKRPSWKRIIIMAVCPALGYLAKQNLVSWLMVMFIFLLLHNPKDIKRLILFITIATALIGAAIGICYLLWGDNFIFWTFRIMGGGRSKIVIFTNGFHISLARSLDHIIRAWPEIAIGVLGGWLILRGHNIRILGPLWSSWIVLVSSEALSSAVGWGNLYHFGPGVLIGTIWLFSALPRFWPWTKTRTDSEFPVLLYWTRPLLAIAAVLTIFIAIHVVPTADRNEARSWHRGPSGDMARYLADIEREFDGLPADKVLLDVGNWIYLRHSILAKDRAISLADQPCAGIYENFDIMINRIRDRAYAKILVHDFHSPLFLYDWAYWEKPTGVRTALLKYYNEVRTIPAAIGVAPPSLLMVHSGPVSVLIPKNDSTAP